MTLARGLKFKIYFHHTYVGFLNGHWRGETSQGAQSSSLMRHHKRERGVGFQLTTDEHYHLKDKRLTNVSAPVDNHDASTKKLVTDLLKTKAGNTYVNNELAEKAIQFNVNKALATLNKKVKELEATVSELQKEVLLLKSSA